jgi:hypothetical protein
MTAATTPLSFVTQSSGMDEGAPLRRVERPLCLRQIDDRKARWWAILGRRRRKRQTRGLPCWSPTLLLRSVIPATLAFDVPTRSRDRVFQSRLTRFDPATLTSFRRTSDLSPKAISSCEYPASARMSSTRPRSVPSLDCCCSRRAIRRASTTGRFMIFPLDRGTNSTSSQLPKTVPTS